VARLQADPINRTLWMRAGATRVREAFTGKAAYSISAYSSWARSEVMWRPRSRSFSRLRLARLWCADPFGQGLVESGGAAVEIDPGDVTVGSDQNSV
jgi:hypothetical protein